MPERLVSLVVLDWLQITLLFPDVRAVRAPSFGRTEGWSVPTSILFRWIWGHLRFECVAFDRGLTEDHGIRSERQDREVHGRRQGTSQGCASWDLSQADVAWKRDAQGTEKSPASNQAQPKAHGSQLSLTQKHKDFCWRFNQPTPADLSGELVRWWLLCCNWFEYPFIM